MYGIDQNGWTKSAGILKKGLHVARNPWPEWTEWRSNQLWCWDGSQFERCSAARYAYAIVDLVSRKWIATILAAEATGIQVRVLFIKALEAGGLLTDELAARLVDLDDQAIGDDNPTVPLLVAISDLQRDRDALPRHSPVHGHLLHRLALRAALHPDRPGLDRGAVGHVKCEHPHMMAITDPAVLAAELERIRLHYNGTRLHEAVGFS